MATNWVKVVEQVLAAHPAESPAELAEHVRRHFVAHELEVVEVDYVLGLRQRVTLLEEKVTTLQGHLTSSAAELGRLGSDLLRQAGT